MHAQNDKPKEPSLVGRPWSLWLALGWAGLAAAVFLSRYWAYVDHGYGLMAKLRTEGLVSVLLRWLGL